MSEEDRAQYGESELHRLTDFFGSEARVGEVVSKPLLQKDACMEEWVMAKEIVMQNHYKRSSTKELYKLLHEFHRDTLPNLLMLACLALILPLQTADCERGFSVQNGIQTAKRSKMGEANLNVLMTIKCEGGPLEDMNFAPAVALWKGKKERRIFNH